MATDVPTFGGVPIYPDTVYDPRNGIAQASCGPSPGELIERRRYEIQGYVQTLREALRIWQNEALMAEIREYIREERGALAEILDQVR